MKKKRILCVLLALLMMISLAACGNDVEVSPPDDTATENTMPTTPETSAPRKLIFKDYGIPAISQFEYIHETLNGFDRSFIKTFMTFDEIDMYAALQNTSFFNESGRNLQMTIGEDAKYYYTNLPMYDCVRSVYGEIGGTEENPDFTITLTSLFQTAYFYTPNSISLTITYNPEAEGYIGKIQDYPYEVLSTLLGADYANYVVYGKDSDGLNYLYDIEEPLLPNDLSDEAESDNGSYMYCRTFGDGYVTYEIFFDEDRALSDDILVGRPIENSTYDELPYKIDSMVGPNFGGSDLNHIHDFGNKVFTGINPEYTTPFVSSVRHAKTYGSNGVDYTIGLTLECLEEEYTVLDYIGTYTVSEDVIVESDLSGYISINGNQDGNIKDEEKRLIGIIQALIPNVTITHIETIDTNEIIYSIQYTYLDIPCEKTIHAYVSDMFAEVEILPIGEQLEHNHNHNHTH